MKVYGVGSVVMHEMSQNTDISDLPFRTFAISLREWIRDQKKKKKNSANDSRLGISFGECSCFMSPCGWQLTKWPGAFYFFFLIWPEPDFSSRDA